VVNFEQAVQRLLSSSWQSLLELQKEKPKEKSTWRKLLGN